MRAAPGSGRADPAVAPARLAVTRRRTAAAPAAKPPSRGPTSAGSPWSLVVGLLALNLWISSQALSPNTGSRIPYNPTFLTQVQGDNVSSISTTGRSIQGTFRRRAVPDELARPTLSFSTQIPSFASNSQLFKLLQKHNVTINAKDAEHRPVVPDRA